MNVDALRIFCEVARQHSFSRAAKDLRLTQPAVSQALQHLERELGCQLLDRSHRPPQLTPHGERFYHSCLDILDRLDQAIGVLHEDSDEAAGPVHVVSIYSVGLYHTDVIRRFMERYPKASVRLQYLRPNLVVEAVRSGEAAIGLLSYPKETRELAVTPWKDEQMVLVCPPGHRLARAVKVRLEDLADENFIAFDADLVIRRKVDAALHRHKVSVHVAMEFDNVETMKQAVQIGAGISILPEATVRSAVEAGTLVAVPLANGELVRPVGIIQRRDKPLSLAAARFIELLTESEGGGTQNGFGAIPEPPIRTARRA